MMHPTKIRRSVCLTVLLILVGWSGVPAAAQNQPDPTTNPAQQTTKSPEVSNASQSGTATQLPNGESPLRWKFATGDRFNVSQIKTGNVESQVDTRIRKVEIKSQLSFRWDVIETGNSSNTTIQQTLTRITLESGEPGGISDQRLIYDSANAAYRKGISNTVAKQLKPLIGLTYQFVITDRGEIKSVLVAAQQQPLLETIPASLPIKDLLTSQGQQANLGAVLWVCPETLDAQRSWTTERTLNSELGTFNRISRFVAGPAVDGLIEIDVLTDVNHDANMALKMFEGKGRIEFDSGQGFAPRSQSTTRMITESPYRDLIVKTKVEMTTEFKMEKLN